MIKIRVPATTANVGPGFDCIGMALTLYNYLSVEETESGLCIEVRNQSGIKIPDTEDNLIYKSIVHFYEQIGKKLPGIHMIQEDYIPLTRGLGSSAACIVSGLMAANELSGEGMSHDALAAMAARIEGHPDNAAPAMLGGMIVGVLNGDEFVYSKIDISDEITFVAMIPSFPLSTEQARGLLPKNILVSDAVFNISRAALLTAAMKNGDWEKLAVATDDRLHQPFRSKVIPNMDKLLKKSRELGAYAAYLSGAGPTLISIVNSPDAERFVAQMKDYVLMIDKRWSVNLLRGDNIGAELCTTNTI